MNRFELPDKAHRKVEQCLHDVRLWATQAKNHAQQTLDACERLEKAIEEANKEKGTVKT